MFGLNINDLITINKYVQNIISFKKISQWFDNCNSEYRKTIIKAIWFLSLQAQLTEDDLENIYKVINIKRTCKPVAMLSTKRKSFKHRGISLSELNGKEQYQAFYLVLECLKFADTRRRENEDPNLCNHWWHRDLSDPKIVKKILRKELI